MALPELVQAVNTCDRCGKYMHVAMAVHTVPPDWKLRTNGDWYVKCVACENEMVVFADEIKFGVVVAEWYAARTDDENITDPIKQLANTWRAKMDTEEDS